MKNNLFHVAILMCTYNGEKFLSDQLLSIESQTHNNWSLYISDDGSTDETISILEKFRKTSKNNVYIYTGPRCGYGANFFSLVINSVIVADYYAFADQDDIWLSNKLERSINILINGNSCVPALYCSSTLIIEKNKPERLSTLYVGGCGLNNALVQNIANGNTMIFNNALREKLFLIGDNLLLAKYHDWLLYIIVTLTDGIVHYDDRPSVYYRQHESNLIGSSDKLNARFNRIKFYYSSQYRDIIDNNLYIVSFLKYSISEERSKQIIMFQKVRSSCIIQRIIYWTKLRLYRQTNWGNINLLFQIILRKI